MDENHNINEIRYILNPINGRLESTEKEMRKPEDPGSRNHTK